MFEQFDKSKKTEVGEESALYNIVRLNPGDILCRLRASVDESSGTRVQVGTSVIAAITCLQLDLPKQLQPGLDLMATEENSNHEENDVAQDQG